MGGPGPRVINDFPQRQADLPGSYALNFCLVNPEAQWGPLKQGSFVDGQGGDLGGIAGGGFVCAELAWGPQEASRGPCQPRVGSPALENKQASGGEHGVL